MALATIKLATSAFVYSYNNETKQLEVCEALQPLMHHTQLEGDCYQGQMAFTHSNLTLTLDFTPSKIAVALDSKHITLDATLQRQAAPLAVCTPTGRRGWTFTQKEPLTALAGHLLIKAHSKFNTDAQAKQIHFSENATLSPISIGRLAICVTRPIGFGVVSIVICQTVVILP